MFVSRKKYNKQCEGVVGLIHDNMYLTQQIDLCKITNQTMQEQLTIEKQRVKDLYIELQLLRNK